MIETKLNKNHADKLNCLKNSTSTQKPTDERENNLIIHGMAEDESNVSDKEKLDDLFETINVECKPTTVFRLGVKQENRIRPLMLRLPCKEDKYAILSKLGRLKYTRRKYEERISVTHDYTLEERKTIKELVKEAKRRNTKEGIEGGQGYEWKVRGTRLVKICMSQA